MARVAACLSAVMLCFLLFLGCGSSSNPAGGGAVTAPFSMTIHDTPPASVTVLSFEVNVTGAALQPGNVSLVNGSNPIQIELTQLQTESAFLSTVNVDTGNYTSLNVTFANPELTVLNNSGSSIGSCANGKVCEIKPSISPTNVTFQGPPFPIMPTQGVPVGFQVDINLNNVLDQNLNVNLGAVNGVTIAQLPSPQPTGELEDLEVSGVVQPTPGSNQFALKTSDGMIFNITVDSNTKFEFNDEGTCPANNFTCIAAGQVLEDELSLLGNGNFLAKEVHLEEAAGQEMVEGTVVSLSGNPPTSFQLVVHDEEPNITNINVGNAVTVTIGNNAKFSVDARSFNIPGGLSFASASDLLVGQELHVRVLGTPSAGPPISFTTDQISLHPSEITAKVGQINQGAGSFTLTNLPPLFTSSITVQTTSQTQFEDLTPNSFAGLATGNNISVEGWLFNTPAPATPVTMAARKVHGRSSSGT